MSGFYIPWYVRIPLNAAFAVGAAVHFVTHPKEWRRKPDDKPARDERDEDDDQ